MQQVRQGEEDPKEDIGGRGRTRMDPRGFASPRRWLRCPMPGAAMPCHTEGAGEELRGAGRKRQQQVCSRRSRARSARRARLQPTPPPPLPVLAPSPLH